MFEPVSSKVDFPSLEESVLAYWDERDIFRRSLQNRRGAGEFVFYDGPPFATGLPHYGHLLAGTIKDIVPRYQTMRGRYVERRFGWDCHGLPIEALAQEALELAGAAGIREKGIDVFNEQCRSMVLRYVGEWERTVRRLGRWVDFERDYKTMDRSFMETIWWVFRQLWDQGRIYRAHRIMPYSWKLNTPLSNFEAGRNYQDVQDPAITVRVRLHGGGELEGAWALLWTTTPWTLPGNLAVCAGPEIEYALVRDAETHDRYLLAVSRIEAYYPEGEGYEILGRRSGRELEGLTYEPLFDYFADHPGAFRVLTDEFVTTGEGTGLVHMAPAYGEDDYRICRKAGIDLVDPLDADCRFTAEVPEYEGEFCKDADKEIIRALRHAGKLVHRSTIQHSYPFCERTDTPLIYRAIEAWYVRVEDLRDRMIAHNETVHWMPGYVGGKRFANWLAEARDWNISRNRFWGSCIPVWIAEDGDTICVGSVEELESLSGQKVEDLHKHVLDEITLERDGKVYRRTPEVLDCWFESGSMPYAQCHYPFEERERFEHNFPADFIAEGLDQTRGWFYTLTVLSTALFDRPAFRNVVVNGLVLAEDGRKMSKRLKNYPDPKHIFDTYGADALRLYMIHSPVVKAESLRFSEEGVKHVLRHFLIPWWNAYSFFVTYANIDGWTPAQASRERNNLMDRWVRSAQARLMQDVTAAMDDYDLQRAVRPFVHFIEDLTNWYIRRSRRRFWKSADDADKKEAYAALYDVLLDLCRIAAPFVPFISEAIYRNLRTEDRPESVHLCDFPTAEHLARDEQLEARMEAVMKAVGMGRLLRSEYQVKTRQPLRRLHVVSEDAALLERMAALESIIADELNVHEVRFASDSSELARMRVKPNFKKLGPELGPKMKAAAAAIGELSAEDARRLNEGGEVGIELDGEERMLDADDVEIELIPREGLAVSAEGPLLVALDTTLDDELVREGLAREFVHKIQFMRKELDLDVVQRIAVAYRADDDVETAVREHLDYILEETLALECEPVEHRTDDMTDWDLNGHECAVAVKTVVPTPGVDSP
ncbi:isoleucine--tRNA ligase [Kiritimatiella glycovorans]|uniref:Isoleucine--tRNA ligase n=1 Tax=Kiritimatiella glycovorans TaxID=1307763 RepID=A0A0G3EC88_9BACT|nr:isoleucine--tRNA ligase [Kiritimatiella glycovorans]AKJ64126.1 Isoleucine--tRNA ligase [Kiritimatiella glycovorans]